MRVLVTQRRLAWAREHLGLDRYERDIGRDVSEDILRLLPATASGVYESFRNHSFSHVWMKIDFLHKAKWIHISKWERAVSNGNWAAVYAAGPGRDAPKPRPLYGTEALRDWRERARKSGRWDYFKAKRRSRYTLKKIRDRGKPASPFDALF